MREKINEILKNTKCLLLDLDGTVYLNDSPIGDVARTLQICRRRGIRIGYVTNNSSKSEREYLEKLRKLELWSDSDLLYTSATIAKELLREKFSGKRVYIAATEAVREDFCAAGVHVTEEDAEVCVLTYDQSITFEKINKFNRFLAKGAYYIATHCDIVCAAANVNMPDVGSFVKLFESSSGRLPDIVTGKPNTFLGEEILRRTGVSREEVTMVGDSLRSDVAFGNNCGFHTIFVLSGAMSAADIEKTGICPSAILRDINEIVQYL